MLSRVVVILISAAALSFAACTATEPIAAERTEVAKEEIVSSDRFISTVERRNFLGIGAPDQSEMMKELRRDLAQKNPGVPERDFANVDIRFSKTNYLLFTRTSIQAEGEIIRSRKGEPPQKPEQSQEPEPPATPEKAPKGNQASAIRKKLASYDRTIPEISGPRDAALTFTEDGRPHFIVNARLRNTDWNMIDPWIPSITALRIPGGSVAQYTWRSEADVPNWLMDHPAKRRQQTFLTDELIETYADFVKDKSTETYFCLNINDKLENQLKIIDRFAHFGVEFTHVEIGNETYLPKFALGKKEGLGFAHTITVDDYIEILDTWIPSLKNYPFKILAVTASRSNDGSPGDAYREVWNAAVFQYAAAHPSSIDGVALHIYLGGADDGGKSLEEKSVHSSDYAFADAFPLPLHITEAGHRGADWSPEGVEAYKNFHRELYEYLKSRQDGSRCGTHVLYNPRNQPGDPYSMFDVNGITPLGEAAKSFPFGEP